MDDGSDELEQATQAVQLEDGILDAEAFERIKVWANRKSAETGGRPRDFISQGITMAVDSFKGHLQTVNLLVDWSKDIHEPRVIHDRFVECMKRVCHRILIENQVTGVGDGDKQAAVLSCLKTDENLLIQIANDHTLIEREIDAIVSGQAPTTLADASILRSISSAGSSDSRSGEMTKSHSGITIHTGDSNSLNRSISGNLKNDQCPTPLNHRDGSKPTQISSVVTKSISSTQSSKPATSLIGTSVVSDKILPRVKFESRIHRFLSEIIDLSLSDRMKQEQSPSSESSSSSSSSGNNSSNSEQRRSLYNSFAFTDPASALDRYVLNLRKLVDLVLRNECYAVHALRMLHELKVRSFGSDREFILEKVIVAVENRALLLSQQSMYLFTMAKGILPSDQGTSAEKSLDNNNSSNDDGTDVELTDKDSTIIVATKVSEWDDKVYPLLRDLSVGLYQRQLDRCGLISRDSSSDPSSSSSSSLSSMTNERGKLSKVIINDKMIHEFKALLDEESGFVNNPANDAHRRTIIVDLLRQSRMVSWLYEEIFVSHREMDYSEKKHQSSSLVPLLSSSSSSIALSSNSTALLMRSSSSSASTVSNDTVLCEKLDDLCDRIPTIVNDCISLLLTAQQSTSPMTASSSEKPWISMPIGNNEETMLKKCFIICSDKDCELTLPRSRNKQDLIAQAVCDYASVAKGILCWIRACFGLRQMLAGDAPSLFSDSLSNPKSVSASPLSASLGGTGTNINVGVVGASSSSSSSSSSSFRGFGSDNRPDCSRYFNSTSEVSLTPLLIWFLSEIAKHHRSLHFDCCDIISLLIAANKGDLKPLKEVALCDRLIRVLVLLVQLDCVFVFALFEQAHFAHIDQSVLEGFVREVVSSLDPSQMSQHRVLLDQLSKCVRLSHVRRSVESSKITRALINQFFKCSPLKWTPL